MILQNKIDVLIQQNELLWTNIFGLTIKVKDTKIVTILDNESDEMSLGVPSP